MNVRVVVADERQANFFDVQKLNGPLALRTSIENPTGGMKDLELETDRAGRRFGGGSAAQPAHHHGVNGERSTERHELTQFAKEVAQRIHNDGWRISACPHRGGRVAFDARGRAHTVWYTEGTRGTPDVLYAIANDGVRFGTPQRVHTSSTSIPDQARLAVRPDGRAVIVWEDATAVRRRVLLREATAQRLGPTRVLSDAVKGYAPEVSIAPDGSAVAAWHEERFPRTITVVMRLDAGPPARRTR